MNSLDILLRTMFTIGCLYTLWIVVNMLWSLSLSAFHWLVDYDPKQIWWQSSRWNKFRYWLRFNQDMFIIPILLFCWMLPMIVVIYVLVQLSW